MKLGGLQDRRLSPLQHARHVEGAERPADLLKLGDRLRRFDIDGVGAGLEVALAAPQRLIHTDDRARIRSRDDEHLLGIACGGRGADLGLHLLARDDLLAGEVAAPLGRYLILHEDRLHAEARIGLDGVGDVLDVAVPVVGVDHHGQRRRVANVAHHRADLAEAHETDVRLGVARADRGKPADEQPLEARHLDEAGAEAIVGAGQDVGPFLLGKLTEGKRSAHGFHLHSMHQRAGGAGLQQDRLAGIKTQLDVVPRGEARNLADPSLDR